MSIDPLANCCEGGGASRLRAANSITATTCSRDKWNQSIISLIEAPTSRLSKTTETGVRVSRNTHAPLTLPGMLSTAGHWDQSRFAMLLPSLHRSLFRAGRWRRVRFVTCAADYGRTEPSRHPLDTVR